MSISVNSYDCTISVHEYSNKLRLWILITDVLQKLLATFTIFREAVAYLKQNIIIIIITCIVRCMKYYINYRLNDAGRRNRTGEVYDNNFLSFSIKQENEGEREVCAA